MAELLQQSGSESRRTRSQGHSVPAEPRQDTRPALLRLVRNIPGALRDGIWGATRVLVVALVASGLALAALLLLFRYVDPPGSMLMLTQRLAGGSVEQHFVPLDQISPNLQRAVVSSEDSGFCRHRGIDFAELEAAMAKAEEEGDDIARGASTITMQVAKNLFLLPTRSYVRKGIEMGMALAIEAVWPKRRILEVYLNIAEWGPGIFGAEAGARYHFRKPASRLTPQEAALMAVTLPNPILRHPSRPGPGLQRLAGIIEARARRVGERLNCLRP